MKNILKNHIQYIQIGVLLLLTILIAVAIGIAKRPLPPLLHPDFDGAPMRAAVLHDGSAAGERLNVGGASDAWKDRYSRLTQPLVLNFEAEHVDISTPFSLDGYDILFPDVTITAARNANEVRAEIMAFAEGGGAVFLDNAFYSFFQNEFIGASGFVKLESYPFDLEFPDNGADLNAVTEIIKDFSELYPLYHNFEALSAMDYGWAAIPEQAVPLVNQGEYALYTMNRFGDGFVFFTNPLLPNSFSINGLTLEERGGQGVSALAAGSIENNNAEHGQEPFASTTVSANILIENAFIEYVMKQSLGFSITRLFGTYTAPTVAWSLHYEEITGIANDSARIFGEIVMEHRQVPSYTIIRNSYWWFLRAESVSTLINQTSMGFEYEMDFYENAYSSGTHVVSGDEWLSHGSIENTGSYFIDYPEYDKRIYPFVADFNDDGNKDLVFGAADGYFYYCRGEGYDERLYTSEKQQMHDIHGTLMSVDSYSAPVIVDLTGNGIPDIISGAGDGNIYIFEGVGNFAFERRHLLIETGLEGQSLPDVADINGDGVLDIIVGSNEGALSIFYGTSLGSYRKADISEAVLELGDWLAPRVVMFDGELDVIALGTFEGYIARLVRRDGEFTLDGFFETTELNFRGNNNLKFGNNAVPFFADLDGDGALDLIVGNLEYGLAYPIDSDYFPYRAELAEQIKWMQDHGFYVSAHFYTSEFSSKQREDYEIAAHIRALEGYGVDFRQTGANQHTWYVSSLDGRQSFLALWEAGFLWNSGFRPAKSKAEPHVCAENTLSLPFYMRHDNGERTILLQNCSNLPYDLELAEISAKYDMPMAIYYHCDFVYESETGARDFAAKASEFQARHGYNFAGEHQMMKASAAAFYANVSVIVEDGKIIIDSMPLNTQALGAKLYDERYAAAVGAKITFSETYNEPMRVSRSNAQEAPVWRYDNGSIYFALNGQTVIEYGEESGSYITRVNLPVRFTELTDTVDVSDVIASSAVAADVLTAAEDEPGLAGVEPIAVIDVLFLDSGMMELAVSGRAITDSPGWAVTEQGDETIFTKFGKPETLRVIIV